MFLGVAFRAFFAALFNRERAEQMRSVLETDIAMDDKPKAPKRISDQTTQPGPGKSLPAPSKSPATRSEALTLLSTLQREARFLDLVHEPLDGFGDAQIGAAAREVLRDCRKTLDRIFAIAALSDEDEGATCTLPDQPSPSRYRLIGKSAGTSGVIAHRGWLAQKCEVPKWNGTEQEARILAPIEVDIP